MRYNGPRSGAVGHRDESAVTSPTTAMPTSEPSDTSCSLDFLRLCSDSWHGIRMCTTARGYASVPSVGRWKKLKTTSTNVPTTAQWRGALQKQVRRTPDKRHADQHRLTQTMGVVEVAARTRPSTVGDHHPNAPARTRNNTDSSDNQLSVKDFIYYPKRGSRQ